MSSFRLIAILLGWLGGQSITKQAVAKRMTSQCIEFVRSALFAVLSNMSKFESLRHSNIFDPFKRVLIQDSTIVRLPSHLASHFPGPSNQNKKRGAALKIQTVYDLLGETFAYFGLSGYTRTDQRASIDILATASQGDLVLRDLGYFSTTVFKQLAAQGVHFLSRLRQNVSIIDQQTLKTFNLLKILRRYGTFDQEILLGAEQRVKARLVALPVPEDVANQRRRKAKNNRDKRCNPSKNALELLGWNILVTTVPSCTWSADMVQQAYGVRWRIEIIFKSWKSHFNLTHTPTGSANQVEVLIWARLLGICLFQTLFGSLELFGFKPISLLKFAQIFPWLLTLSVNALSRTGLNIEPVLKHLELEKRKKHSQSASKFLS